MKQIIALVVLIPNLLYAQIEFKSTEHFQFEKDAKINNVNYDSINEFFYAASNSELTESYSYQNIEFLTLENIDDAVIDFTKYPNLKSCHILNSALRTINIPENNLEGLWIDELVLDSGSIDLKDCKNLKEFKVDYCQECKIENIAACDSLELVVLAGIMTDQTFTEELLTLKNLERIILVEFNYSIEEAQKMEAELKKKFPKAFISIIL